MTEKRCRVCNYPLHNSNWSEGRQKKNDNICKVCKAEELKSIVVKESKILKKGYSIVRMGHKAPTISVDGTFKISLKDIINSTELYRMEQVLRLIVAGNDDKVRRIGIDYLLKVNDLLTDEQLADVVNQANLMMLQAGVDDETKLRVAISLRNFAAAKDGKTEKVKSYEELIKEPSGEIEIDEV